HKRGIDFKPMLADYRDRFERASIRQRGVDVTIATVSKVAVLEGRRVPMLPAEVRRRRLMRSIRPKQVRAPSRWMARPERGSAEGPSGPVATLVDRRSPHPDVSHGPRPSSAPR